MEVLRRYCQLARYEEALYSARVFRADMTVIFTMMVDMCMRLSKGGEAALLVCKPFRTCKYSPWVGRRLRGGGSCRTRL